MTILLELGTKVRIYPDQVNDRLPSRLIKLLVEEPSGKLLRYKITDGKGIGMVLQLSDGSVSWFFDYELDLEPIGYSDELSRPNLNHSEAIPIDSKIGGDSIIDLLNPIYFGTWLIDSLKDVF